MPTSEAPTNVNEPAPSGTPVLAAPPAAGESDPDRFFAQPAAPPQPDGSASNDPESDQPAPVVRGSRWVDYDTHELLELISDLEDERRWARLREGIWIAILFHFVLLSLVTWIPKYVFHVAPVIDPFDAIKQRKDLTYLDLPPDALRNLQPKVTVKPVPPKLPQIDRKTLEALNKPVAPPEPRPAPEPLPPAPPATQPQPAPIPPSTLSQAPVEAPRPTAVPARPNFALGSQNPADQLREAMKRASHPGGPGADQVPPPSLPRHPGAGSGAQIISDTQGVDFSRWLQRWYVETENTWDPLVPDEVNAPILKSGMVVIRFKVLPNGRLVEPDGIFLEGRSGDTALDRAAWGAITGSNYPPLPHDFHGPYIELRAVFEYNMGQPK
jgi:hypothetical protein